MKTAIPRVKAFLLVFLIAGVFFLSMRFIISSQDNPEGDLGIKLPQTARNIRFEFEYVRGLRVVTMWARMDIPLDDAERLAKELDLSSEYVFFYWPSPEQKIAWWDAPSAEEIYAISNRWMKVGGNLKPGSLCFVWNKGHLYIYHHGLYGFCKDIKSKKPLGSEGQASK